MQSSGTPESASSHPPSYESVAQGTGATYPSSNQNRPQSPQLPTYESLTTHNGVGQNGPGTGAGTGPNSGVGNSHAPSTPAAPTESEQGNHNVVAPPYVADNSRDPHEEQRIPSAQDRPNPLRMNPTNGQAFGAGNPPQRPSLTRQGAYYREMGPVKDGSPSPIRRSVRLYAI